MQRETQCLDALHISPLCSEQQTWHPKNLELSQRGQVRNDVAFGHLFFWALRAVESSPQANGMNFAIPNPTDSGAEVNWLQDVYNLYNLYVYIVSDLWVYDSLWAFFGV